MTIRTAESIPATYAEAIAAGYRNSDTAYQRGYVSRRSDLDSARVMIAGGSRAGQLYVLRPCMQSSQYCIRQYLKKASK